MAARQKIHAGMIHAGKTAAVIDERPRALRLPVKDQVRLAAELGARASLAVGSMAYLRAPGKDSLGF
jgi:hypothetical protein